MTISCKILNCRQVRYDPEPLYCAELLIPASRKCDGRERYAGALFTNEPLTPDDYVVVEHYFSKQKGRYCNYISGQTSPICSE